jgi:hypothetical protein
MTLTAQKKERGPFAPVAAGKKAVAFTLGVLALALGGQETSARRAAPAASRCNPPAPRLEYTVWYSACEGVLQARFRDSNPYRLPYTEYVRMLWQVYDVRYHLERYPGLPGSQCWPEGSGYMNPSGHPLYCVNGKWSVSSR